MPRSLSELTEQEQMALFHRMVQTGATVHGALQANAEEAMAAVDVAATVTLEDLQQARTNAAAAAYQFIAWYFDQSKPKEAEKPEWLHLY